MNVMSLLKGKWYMDCGSTAPYKGAFLPEAHWAGVSVASFRSGSAETGRDRLGLLIWPYLAKSRNKEISMESRVLSLWGIWIYWDSSQEEHLQDESSFCWCEDLGRGGFILGLKMYFTASSTPCSVESPADLRYLNPSGWVVPPSWLDLWYTCWPLLLLEIPSHTPLHWWWEIGVPTPTPRTKISSWTPGPGPQEHEQDPPTLKALGFGWE